jgi:hypothetical protein
MTDRLFVLTLRPLPGVDGARAIRALLKVALRQFGLQCIAIRRAETSMLEQSSQGDVADIDAHGSIDGD